MAQTSRMFALYTAVSQALFDLSFLPEVDTPAGDSESHLAAALAVAKLEKMLTAVLGFPVKLTITRKE